MLVKRLWRDVEYLVDSQLDALSAGRPADEAVLLDITEAFHVWLTAAREHSALREMRQSLETRYLHEHDWEC